MPCSPLLKGVREPLEVLRIISKHPILCYSEPPQTFYPLEEKGWTAYKSGCWRITDEGYKALADSPDEPAAAEPLTLAEFFDLE